MVVLIKLRYLFVRDSFLLYLREEKMKKQLKFVLGWVKYNRLMTIVYVVVLSMIACSSILLMQFFCEQSTYNQEGKYYYCYYFDESLSDDIAQRILSDIYSMGLKPIEYEVAIKNSEYDTGNEYTFASYYVMDEEEQKVRNSNYSYGGFENEKNTYIADSASASLNLGQCEFEQKGEGAIVIGSCGCDYLITADDYKKYINKVDVVEITLIEKSSQIDDIIDAYTKQYTEETSTGILESGVESIKSTALVSLILILVSFYSALSFVEILINLQKRDIAVFYQCGASQKIIRKLYVAEVLVAGAFSFFLGSLLAILLVKILDFNFEYVNLWVYILSFLIYHLCYYLESVICIKKTLRYVGIISRESD